MKTSPRAATVAVATLLIAVMTIPCEGKRRKKKDSSSSSSSNQESSTEKSYPELPSGWISAFPTMVQTGTHPTLTWGINYPSIVEDYITIDDDVITADEDVECEIRILGAGVTVRANNALGYNFVPTESLMSISNSSYSRLFFGTNLDINPSEVVNGFTLKKNQSLKFGGRYYYNRRWGPFFHTDSSSDNVRVLVNGDTPPSNIPDYNAPSLESFVRPYLNQDRTVNIGPMDVIVFMELTHTDKSSIGYDLQDMVILVTFKSKARTNNGHGNNLDGIDSSNPGSAPFINLDTDPNVDDEGSGGGAYPSN